MYAYKDAEKVLRRFRDLSLSSVPDELTVFACLIYDAGEPVVAIAACYAGPMEHAEAAIAPLRGWGTIVADQMRNMAYRATIAVRYCATLRSSVCDALEFHGGVAGRGNCH